MIKLCEFEKTGTLIQHALELLRTTLANPGGLMLSGGSTPYVIYNRLAEAP